MTMPLFLSETTQRVLALSALWVGIGVVLLLWGFFGRKRWPRQSSMAIAGGIGVVIIGAVGAMMASVM